MIWKTNRQTNKQVEITTLYRYYNNFRLVVVNEEEKVVGIVTVSGKINFFSIENY